MNRMFALRLSTALALCLPGMARADIPCAPHDQMAETLADRYGESPVGIGLIDDGRMVEVFASGISGTWTFVVTTPDRMSCTFAEGRSYEQIANTRPPPPGTPG